MTKNYAHLDENNVVINVVTVADKEEPEAIEWLTSSFGGTWLVGDDAGIGMNYDPTTSVFYEARPFDSWALDPKSLTWVAPKQIPDDTKRYLWVENSKSWQQADII